MSHVYFPHPPRWVSLFSPFLPSFVYQSQTLQAVAAGWQAARAKHPSEIDRQVWELLVVPDTSAEAQRCSSSTLPASPHRHHPASLWEALSHSFGPQIAFSPALALLESRGALRILSAAFEKFRKYWFGSESPAGWPEATPGVTRLKTTSPSGFPAHKVSFYVLSLRNLVSWEFICIKGQKAALRPRGLIQALFWGDVLRAAHCWVHYTAICLVLIYGYLWLCSKRKWSHWSPGFLTGGVHSQMCLALVDLQNKRIVSQIG